MARLLLIISTIVLVVLGVLGGGFVGNAIGMMVFAQGGKGFSSSERWLCLYGLGGVTGGIIAGRIVLTKWWPRTAIDRIRTLDGHQTPRHMKVINCAIVAVTCAAAADSLLLLVQRMHWMLPGTVASGPYVVTWNPEWYFFTLAITVGVAGTIVGSPLKAVRETIALGLVATVVIIIVPLLLMDIERASARNGGTRLVSYIILSTIGFAVSLRGIAARSLFGWWTLWSSLSWIVVRSTELFWRPSSWL